ncbi:DNA methylase [Porphyromonas gingivalis]|uniref:DNA methylase n=1 Tax=Porphyromonas gingivalis TaxID=837 RepID=UPI000C19D9D5|nr:DNA methylase [Porphyromonas gingivalis]ATS07174.1 DNA methylase [Porphyromonas gingivalis]RZQ67214.1 DNA methylase [Porphyromonas gingivalis]
MQAAPQGGIYNYFHSLLPPLSLAPFMPRTPLPSTSLFFKGLFIRMSAMKIFTSVTIITMDI